MFPDDDTSEKVCIPLDDLFVEKTQEEIDRLKHDHSLLGMRIANLEEMVRIIVFSKKQPPQE